MDYKQHEERLLHLLDDPKAKVAVIDKVVDDLIKLGSKDKRIDLRLNLFTIVDCIIAHPSLSVTTFKRIMNHEMFFAPFLMILTFSRSVRQDLRAEMYKSIMDEKGSKKMKEIMIRFFNEHTTLVYETNQFIEWYDETYDMDVKLSSFPKSMVPSILGWK
jgi:hypothetical protein